MAARKPQFKKKSKARIAQVRASHVVRDLRLAGKVAVVTGASRGIGQAIAQALAAEGCSVVITGRDEEALKKSAARISKSVGSQSKSAQIVPIVCDVRYPDSVASLFATVKKIFGKIDVLVNN